MRWQGTRRGCPSGKCKYTPPHHDIPRYSPALPQILPQQPHLSTDLQGHCVSTSHSRTSHIRQGLRVQLAGLNPRRPLCLPQA